MLVNRREAKACRRRETSIRIRLVPFMDRIGTSPRNAQRDTLQVGKATATGDLVAERNGSYFFSDNYASPYSIYRAKLHFECLEACAMAFAAIGPAEVFACVMHPRNFL